VSVKVLAVREVTNPVVGWIEITGINVNAFQVPPGTVLLIWSVDPKQTG
jgi:hypothetical protein